MREARCESEEVFVLLVALLNLCARRQMFLSKGKKKAFLGIAVAFLYEKSETTAFMIEVKYDKIDKADTKIVENMHRKNIRDGEAQVVVSGV